MNPSGCQRPPAPRAGLPRTCSWPVFGALPVSPIDGWEARRVRPCSPMAVPAPTPGPSAHPAQPAARLCLPSPDEELRGLLHLDQELDRVLAKTAAEGQERAARRCQALRDQVTELIRDRCYQRLPDALAVIMTQRLSAQERAILILIAVEAMYMVRRARARQSVRAPARPAPRPAAADATSGDLATVDAQLADLLARTFAAIAPA